ncbi:MAG: hypothetical protein AABW59_00565 [archaeon]
MLPYLVTQGFLSLLFLEDLFGDMTVVLKIFTLMAIISYITNHLGKGPIALIIITVISSFIIFDFFALFGGIYILYILLGMGLTGVIIDIFFVTPMAPPKGQEGGGAPSGEPISNGKDFTERQAHYMSMMRGGKR